MADSNESGSLDETQQVVLPPGMEQTESMMGADHVFDQILKRASLKLYRKYIDSRTPEFLADWYLSNCAGLAEVLSEGVASPFRR